MKILNSKRYHQVARISIFLILVTLIAGMVSCGGGGGGGGQSYTLTVDFTAGGVVAVNNVPVPGKALLTYNPGTVVRLNATPSADYRFIRWIGNVSTIVNTTATVTTITMNGDYNVTACFQADFMVSAGLCHTVGLKSDGTAVAVENNLTAFAISCPVHPDVTNWTNIVQISAGLLHTVGLKSDGTVIAVGLNETELGLNVTPCDVSNWTDIVQVSAGWLHTVGLKSDGTVVAVGWNDFGQCDVGNWTDIIQVAAGGTATVGLKSDGTVVAVGWNDFGQCDVGNWTNIIQVATAGGNGAYLGLPGCSGGNTLGLKSDGTVVAVGDNSTGQCDVGGWDLN
jgi:alpha-tubulin suppressor-like RCC1 family protein